MSSLNQDRCLLFLKTVISLNVILMSFILVKHLQFLCAFFPHKDNVSQMWLFFKYTEALAKDIDTLGPNPHLVRKNLPGMIIYF